MIVTSLFIDWASHGNGVESFDTETGQKLYYVLEIGSYEYKYYTETEQAERIEKYFNIGLSLSNG